ncbi:C40 family peptidase [Nocardioides marmorisolisilvae]|uniref:C40 family peptidase n=1 Tax=Nocardioides marmorisolisilvae TaxID=1542737 RepID=UPI001FE6B1E2|nr:NlpC/P60 family protein [Nocardioides marmorisolisilvae]
MTALVTVGIGLAAPSADAKPDLKTVKKQVQSLDRQAEAASERFNAANVRLAATKMRLSALNADLGRQQRLVDDMREQVAALVVDQYQGNALSTTSQVVLSSNPDKFLDNLSAVSAYNNQRGQVMKEFSAQLSRLYLRKHAVKAEARHIAKLKAQMAQEKAQIDKKAAKAHRLLDSLQPAVRASYYRTAAKGYTGPLPAPPSNPRAATAVKFALAQVGKAYSYGASGPNAYDCSGLTMAAWGAAGVSLPHSSSAQTGSGARVSESDLEPGDLVFYYSPVSHVGMYIGNGLIVNAENPSSGVRVQPLHSMPYVGAVRPG